jgi:glycosyltransferase involved in cell wall biosynthesis
VLVDPRGDTRPYDHALAAALAARGHRVTLETSRFPHGDLPPAPGVDVHERFYRVVDRLPGLPSRARRVLRGLEHPLDLLALGVGLTRVRPDVVHVQWLPLHGVDRTFWRVLRRLLGVPVVFTAHDAIPLRATARRIRRSGRNARAFERVVSHSDFGARALVERLGVRAERVVQVPHGALDSYRDGPRVPPAVPDGVPVVGFLGLIRPYKGLDTLLEAWPRVRAAVPDAVLLVAGRPLGEPAGARATAMAAAGAGVVADLRFLSTAEFAGALTRSDVVVLPYRRIDLSGVLFAAMALGRPLVVSDVGGFREVVGGSGAGVLVPPDDPEALAGALVRLLLDPEEARRLGSAGRRAAESTYSWEVAAERTEALYASVVDGS